MKCLVSRGGLFIPLDHHIELFCTTAEHCSCLQYISHQTHGEQLLIDNMQEKLNRRHYLRVEAKHRLKLMRMMAGGSQLAVPAKVLDLSQGGMRVSLESPLTGDSLLQFSFEPSFPAGFHEGLGQVAWCHKEIAQAGYQAGIAFQDAAQIRAMASYLEHC
jgi:hypothetical protein